MRFNQPNSSIVLTGLADIDLKFDLTLLEALTPAARTSVQFLDTPTGQSGEVFFTHSTLSTAKFATQGDVEINSTSMSHLNETYDLAASSLISIIANAAGHAGTVTLLNDELGSRPFYCEIDSLVVRDNSDDSILHSFDFSTLDLTTGQVSDSVGAGVVCTLVGYGFEEPLVLNAPTSVTAGQSFDAIVNDSDEYESATFAGSAISEDSIVDINTIRYTAPTDGIQLGSSPNLVLTAITDAIRSLFTPTDIGDFWFSNKHCIPETPPLVNGGNVIGLKGGRNQDCLKISPGIYAVYGDNQLSHPSGNRQMRSSLRIDPAVNGITSWICFGFSGTATSVEPDIFWGNDHANPGCLVLDGTDDLRLYLTDNVTDDITLSGYGNGKPVRIVHRYVPGTNTLTVTVNGVEHSSFNPVGTVRGSGDLTFLCGDRGGVTHDFWSAGQADKVLSDGDVATLDDAMLAAALLDGADPYPFPLGLFGAGTTGNYFDSTVAGSILDASGNPCAADETVANITFLRDNSLLAPTNTNIQWNDNGLSHPSSHTILFDDMNPPDGWNEGCCWFATLTISGSNTGSAIIFGSASSGAHHARFKAASNEIDWQLPGAIYTIPASYVDGNPHTYGWNFDPVAKIVYVYIDGVEVTTIDLSGGSAIWDRIGLYFLPGTRNGTTVEMHKYFGADLFLNAQQLSAMQTLLTTDLRSGGANV